MSQIDDILSIFNSSLTGVQIPTGLNAQATDWRIYWSNANGRFEKQPLGVQGVNMTVSPIIMGAVSTSQQTTSLSEIEDHINEAGFTIPENSLKIIQLIIRKNNKLYIRNYLYNPNGAGSYGNGVGNTEVDLNDFYAFPDQKLNIEELEKIVIELGNIDPNSISTHINTTTPPGDNSWSLLSGVFYIFNATENSIDNSYIYIGNQPLQIGLGGNTVNNDDFFLIESESTGESAKIERFTISINGQTEIILSDAPNSVMVNCNRAIKVFGDDYNLVTNDATTKKIVLTKGLPTGSEVEVLKTY